MALTLRLLGGLTVAEIAAAFLVPETTMAQRITRSKQKIKVAHIPYRIPRAEDLPERLGAVLAVLYLIFNEGYLGSSGEAQRTDLTTEAIRLARQLREMVTGTPSLGRQPEVDGLLALMLLTDSRRRGPRARRGAGRRSTSRTAPCGTPTMIDEGHQLVRALPGPEPAGALPGAGGDQRRAHRCARRLDDRLDPGAALFDQLLALSPSPVVALNRAVAVAEVDGPEVALALVEPLALECTTPGTRPGPTCSAGSERTDEARAAYDRAIELAGNDAEREFLRRRREQLNGRPR